ncbi:MAG: DUF4433 domain-containing protein [Fibrobacteria bacterium]|nr:DUF4433 domain-containing protein [Fibrobacteria bacterium]
MPEFDPCDPLLYHITHLDNLPAIVRQGGLWAKGHLPEGLQQTDLADPNIQDRRHALPVPGANGRCLHDYVPFYFCPKSPMLYRRRDHQRRIVYLVTRPSLCVAQGLDWVFTDSHAVTMLARFTRNRSDLERLDWDAIHSDSWGGEENQEIRRCKQAEWLVYRFVPLGVIAGLAAMTPEATDHASNCLQVEGVQVACKTMRSWYF